MRIQFDAVSAPASFFGSEQRGAAASECIQDNAATFGAIENSIADQGERFRCRMSGKRRLPVLPETAHAGIFPDVCSAAAKAAKFDVIDVLCAAVLVDKDEFVGRPI